MFKHIVSILPRIANSGTSFLVPDEIEVMKAEEKKGKKERFNFLIKTVSPRLEPLWFFVVSLCRALQEGEYPMTPIEAYWAGLVDEVIGKDAPCLRARIESINDSSNAQPPPVEQSATSGAPKASAP
jgi:hypothetical protein